MSINIHIYIYILIDFYIYIHQYKCSYICIYKYVYIYIYVYTFYHLYTVYILLLFVSAHALRVTIQIVTRRTSTFIKLPTRYLPLPLPLLKKYVALNSPIRTTLQRTPIRSTCTFIHLSHRHADRLYFGDLNSVYIHIYTRI